MNYNEHSMQILEFTKDDGFVSAVVSNGGSGTSPDSIPGKEEYM